MQVNCAFLKKAAVVMATSFTTLIRTRTSVLLRSILYCRQEEEKEKEKEETQQQVVEEGEEEEIMREYIREIIYDNAFTGKDVKLVVQVLQSGIMPHRRKEIGHYSISKNLENP